MSYDLIGGYPYDDFDGVAGEEDEYGAAGAIEIIGYDDDDVLAGLSDDELDAISGLDEDLGVLAGYEVPSSEVTRLLQATAGLATPRGARGRRPGPDPRRRAAARRVARTVNGLGRQLQRERGRTAQLAQALQRNRGTAPSAQGAPNARAIPAAGGGQRVLVPREPAMSTIDPIGINSDGPVPEGQTRDIAVRPQTLFRPIRYHISEAVGQNFLIRNITIGKHSMLGTSGALPATTFSVEDLKFAWRTCQSGQEIVVSVQNIASAPHVFVSTMWGDATE